jgi:hypothetical protein
MAAQPSTPESTHEPLDAVDEFIAVGRELAAVPAMGSDKYRAAAKDLYEISVRLSKATENLARLLNRFVYFDFRADDARSTFIAEANAYDVMKKSSRFRDLKWRCSEISQIYGDHIEGSLVDWFGRKRKNKKKKSDWAADAFTKLGTADGSMVEFIYDELVSRLDGFVKEVDPGDLEAAEAKRLEFAVQSAGLTGRLDRLSSGLADLILKFSQLAKVRVALD